ncbi:hypothetical protein OE88DRAFT_1721696 [Heliocybe sulcata]|uniref:Uncharacterized protein n=1 Tax=Heliocybe sulcata TaxID=5364 RepID=A0A5C3NF19_9AGAM|nr:hypothetical protein OE88DRAFT_1721696 [Heliocybe sulcata]
MSPEIRFTPDGVPYLVEFSNISFRSQNHAPHQRKPIPAQFTRASYLSTSSSLSLSLSPTDDDGPGGLYIHFPARAAPGGIPFPSVPSKRTSRSKLMRLRKIIASSVLDAGMDTPAEQKADPLAEAGRRLNRRQSVVSSHSSGGAGAEKGAALFSGTYGQVVDALTGAGLAIARCGENGFEHATRLGALFVVNNTSTGELEFRKLTLWA